MKRFTMAAAFAVLAAPAFADGHASTQGDAVAGEEQFNRQCVACHVVQDASGEVLAGRNAKTGPNLYGIAGRTIGSVDGFRYGDSIVDVGKADGVWTEETFVGYVQDPTGWLRATLEDRRARGKMAYQVRDESQAYDLYAYLSTFGEEEAEATN
ncbi:cytochrome c family protein [Yoonia sp.]|uniref:c-type cytochrome n=1 Tax=Yoonia sp. TaxID=2212373 RepID=UPI0019E22180|nr:c-type cytochrome [Yoonia sp.]MBE0412799.1 c-type cytochrome [Yoonia sp.]